jgi:hypothetical protein
MVPNSEPGTAAQLSSQSGNPRNRDRVHDPRTSALARVTALDDVVVAEEVISSPQ